MCGISHNRISSILSIFQRCQSGNSFMLDDHVLFQILDSNLSHVLIGYLDMSCQVPKWSRYCSLVQPFHLFPNNMLCNYLLYLLIISAHYWDGNMTIRAILILFHAFFQFLEKCLTQDRCPITNCWKFCGINFKLIFPEGLGNRLFSYWRMGCGHSLKPK